MTSSHDEDLGAALDKPLPGILRQSAEGSHAFSQEILRDAVSDVRRMLNGEPRSSTFKSDTDPVDLVIEGATQVELGRMVIQLDDEARKPMRVQQRQDIVLALKWVARFYTQIEGDAPTETQFVARITEIAEKLG